MLYISEIDELIESKELDQLGRKSEFQHYFNLNVGDISADGTVVVGKNGYLFINDGSNHWREQLSGQIKIHPDQLNASVHLLEDYRRKCNERGIKFEFVVIPEKDVVLSGLSPNVTDEVAPRRTVQDFLDNISFRAVYPYEQMTTVPADVRIFHRRDSHFNFLGGFIVANEVLKAHNARPLRLLECKSDLVSWQDDLSSKWAMFQTMRRQLRKDYIETVIKESETTHMGLHLLIQSTRVTDGSTIVIYGDSYSWNYDGGLARFLTLRYQNVHFVWHKRIDWELVDAIKPSILILESAERFLFRGI